jgi:hypothetical protein
MEPPVDNSSRKPAAPAVRQAAEDAARQEVETSGLTPDQRTVMKPQETGSRTLHDTQAEAATREWPFPAPRDSPP